MAFLSRLEYKSTSIQIKMACRKSLIGYFIFCSITVFGQLPQWSWVKSFGGKYNDWSYNIKSDNKNNLYMIGFFHDTISFDNIILKDTSIWTDVYIAKFDSSGNVKWAKRIGGTKNDEGYSIAVDKYSNVYITGRFESPLLKFGNSILNSLGGTDFFIAKYDSSGNELWAKCAGGNAEDQGTYITTDIYSNVYVTGHFHSSSITFGSITLTNLGSADYFIVKYDSTGNVLWAKSAGGIYNDYGLSLYSDIYSNVYVTGFFSKPSMIVGNYILNNQGSDDFFIIKYDSIGNVKWAKSGGSTGKDIGQSLVGDSLGNIYLSGSFNSSNLTFDNLVISNASNNDIFISKIDSSGNILWLRGYGSTNDEIGNITIDNSMNIFLTGFFYFNTTFGNYLLDNMGQYDIFIAKFDTSGSVNWATSVGSINSERSYDITTIGSDNVYITGMFYTNPFGNTNLPYTGGESDIFIAKLSNLVSGIDIINDNNLIQVFPNPTTSRLNVIIPNNVKLIQIYNTLGQIVYSKINVKESLVIENLTTGVYYILIQTENKIISKKIIINK